MIVAAVDFSARERTDGVYFKEIIAVNDVSSDSVYCVSDRFKTVAFLYFKALCIHYPAYIFGEAAEHSQYRNKIGNIGNIDRERLVFAAADPAVTRFFENFAYLPVTLNGGFVEVSYLNFRAERICDIIERSLRIIALNCAVGSPVTLIYLYILYGETLVRNAFINFNAENFQRSYRHISIRLRFKL